MTLVVFHNFDKNVPVNSLDIPATTVRARSTSVLSTIHYFENLPGHNWLVVHHTEVPLFNEHFLNYRGELCNIYNGEWMIYKVWSEEEMYKKLMRDVLHNGSMRMDRTSVGTRSMFGKQLQFNLKDNRLPMMTTKRVFFKGVAKELLWFLKGSTNARSLRDDGIHIWDGNSSRTYLDSRGLNTYEEGELGPIYGYQWRHWGKPYKTESTEGTDQIQHIIQTIRNNPNDRRMILSAWNVTDLPHMALPPCHILAQFYVELDPQTDTKYLSCSMYQRSADLFLGVPFNITSYALLTHMIAHVTGCVAHRLIMNFGDAHVYNDHIEQVKTQLDRDGFTFPTVSIDCDTSDIDDIEYEHLHVHNYKCHAGIKAPMAV